MCHRGTRGNDLKSQTITVGETFPINQVNTIKTNLLNYPTATLRSLTIAKNIFTPERDSHFEVTYWLEHPMRIQTTFLATLLTAITVFATDCAAQSHALQQLPASQQADATSPNASRFRFVTAQQNTNSVPSVNPAIQISPVKHPQTRTVAPVKSRPRTTELVAATFETSNNNDFGLSLNYNDRQASLQPTPANSFQYQAAVESPSSTRTNIFGIDEDQCCDEWENFTACGGLKTNPGHYGIPWLTGKDNCEAARGCGCGIKRPGLGCGTPACDSTAIRCTKLKGIKGWFKKSDCQCDSCQTEQPAAIEYVEEK